jgi:hypothetical protein
VSSDAQERRAVVRLAWFVVWLVVRAYAETRPKVTIMLNGSPYLTRWFLTSTPEPGRTGTPGWYLHHVHRADADRRQHNHPWTWATSLILRGWYVDESPCLCHHAAHSERLSAGARNVLFGSSYHRIAAVSRGGAWSLFHAGPKHGHGWGPRP